MFVQRHPFSTFIVLTVFVPLSTGDVLHFIHNRGVTHRDIKPGNILLTSKNYDECHLKISDFGIAKILERDQTLTDKGTKAFKAPEVESGHYTYKIDIWSAGVVLYYMLTGSVSLFGESRDEAMKIFEKEPDCVAQGIRPFLLSAIQSEVINGPCLQVLQSLLVYDPDERKDWDEIICLDWLTEGKEERFVNIGGIAYKYYTKPLLGKGASCKVFKGVMASTPEVPVAVKVVKEEYVRRNSDLFDREMRILSRLREQQCEEFVKFFGQTEGDGEGNHFVIFEYCNCTLASQIIGGVCETVAHGFMKQIGLFFHPSWHVFSSVFS